MRTFKTEAIIIKRRNFSEADRILTVLTRSHGKIQIKAAGIRRIPSRRSAHVELLNHSFLSLYKGSHMPILTEAQEIENFSPVKNDLDAMGHAYHLCELIDGLCPENQENYQVFDLLKNTLTKLSLYSTHPSSCHCEEHPAERGRRDASKKLVPLWESNPVEAQTEYIMGEAYTTGPQTFPMVHESSTTSLIRDFEIELLSTLGYWNKAHLHAQNFNTHNFIETILERKLKTRRIFAKLQ